MSERSAELSVQKFPLAGLSPAERAGVLDQAIERYGRGESVYQVAQDLGVEHTTLYRHLIKEREQDWKDAKISHALADLESAESQQKNAPDMLALSRARECVRSAQWHLERLLRRIYGQDQPANLSQAVQININLRGKDAQVVEDQSLSLLPDTVATKAE